MTSRRSIAAHRDAVAATLAAHGLDPAWPEALGTEDVALDRATLAHDARRLRGRVVAEDVVAPLSLPPFDNSQMDGYAVRAADLATASPEAPRTMTVAPRIVAGEAGAPLGVGTAAPIMTGAPVPPGADAVVPIEDVVPPRFGDHPTVSFTTPVAAGTFIRAAGSDIRRGELLLAAGSALTPAALGVLAAAGRTRVTLRRRVRVLLTVTGHEVRAPGAALASGQISDANSFSLWAALTDAGADVDVAPCESDDPDVFAALVDEHGAVADLILTVGGVSAGAREVVRDVFGPRGVWFGSVAMQPGGPQGLGAVDVAGRAVPVLCFPGNPVSCLVSFEVFLRPILVALATGRTVDAAARARAFAPLADALTSPAGKHQVRRGMLDESGRVKMVGGPSSHLLHAYARSTHLVHVPEDVTALAAGDEVEIWRLDAGEDER